MGQEWELAEAPEGDHDGEWQNTFKKEEQPMKTVMRWGFFIAGSSILFLSGYYLVFPFWPLHFSFGWRYSHIGPRMWPFFPFLGMLILFVAGILIAKYFFQALRDSSISKREELTFCPYCGKDLKQGKSNN
jgi:hypothetical protein